MSLPGNQAKLEAADRLAQLADEAGMSLIHLALAFVISHPAVTSAIIGPRTMDQLESQLGAADVVLSAEILDQDRRDRPARHHAQPGRPRVRAARTHRPRATPPSLIPRRSRTGR